MKVKECLEGLNINTQVTFIIEFKASVTEHTSETLYRQTPIRPAWEWLKSDLKDYEVTGLHVRPLVSTWQVMYDNDSIKCLKITNEYDYIYGMIYMEPRNKIIYGSN